MSDKADEMLREAEEAAVQMAKWRARRDDRIRQARSEGATLRRAAAAINVHHSTIVEIEKGER